MGLSSLPESTSQESSSDSSESSTRVLPRTAPNTAPSSPPAHTPTVMTRSRLNLVALHAAPANTTTSLLDVDSHGNRMADDLLVSHCRFGEPPPRHGEKGPRKRAMTASSSEKLSQELYDLDAKAQQSRVKRVKEEMKKEANGSSSKQPTTANGVRESDAARYSEGAHGQIPVPQVPEGLDRSAERPRSRHGTTIDRDMGRAPAHREDPTSPHGSSRGRSPENLPSSRKGRDGRSSRH